MRSGRRCRKSWRQANRRAERFLERELVAILKKFFRRCGENVPIETGFRCGVLTANHVIDPQAQALLRHLCEACDGWGLRMVRRKRHRPARRDHWGEYDRLTGFVVTKAIPANVIAGGNPCRVIRAVTQADQAGSDPSH